MPSPTEIERQRRYHEMLTHEQAVIAANRNAFANATHQSLESEIADLQSKLKQYADKYGEL